MLYFDIFNEERLSELFYEDEIELKDDPKLRPDLEDDKEILEKMKDDWIIKLMKECWSHDPSKRPSFEVIVELLESKMKELKFDKKMLLNFVKDVLKK